MDLMFLPYFKNIFAYYLWPVWQKKRKGHFEHQAYVSSDLIKVCDCACCIVERLGALI